MTTTRCPLRTWAAVLFVVVSGLWQCNASVADIIAFGSGANQFNMEFVTIGNPGNLDDTTGSPNPAGSVAYEYQMGKFEVSEDMITKFNASQALQITKDTRGVNKPATSVSWNEAARFVNWLNTSTGGFSAYKASGGVNSNITPWTVADTLDYDPTNPYRSLRATYVLPSMDEWYKAAFYNPHTSTYSDFANGLDTAPTSVANGTAANTAVYGRTNAQGPADIMSAGGLSPYGIMGLGGNVYEWEETAFLLNNSLGSSNRGVRGGAWGSAPNFLSSTTRLNDVGVNPIVSSSGIGFRVASLTSSAAAVPEPGSFAVLTLLGITSVAYRKRKRK